MNTDNAQLSLDDQYTAFLNNRFMAMPIAGAIMWTLIGIAGAILPLYQASLALYIGTGSIFYLGIGVARLTGEDLLGKERKGNFFDRVFLLSTGSALLVFGIAIPFALVEPTSLPLSVGILTGLMWLPFSGLIKHWVGLFHAVSRTLLILALWYAFPDNRFVLIPAAIVSVYIVTLLILNRRYAALKVE